MYEIMKLITLTLTAFSVLHWMAVILCPALWSVILKDLSVTLLLLAGKKRYQFGKWMASATSSIVKTSAF